jgi:hypothetical protein
MQIHDLNRAAFIWAATDESPSIEFSGSQASFGFNNPGEVAAALAAFESGGMIEARLFSLRRDALYRRIRGAK